MTKKKTTKKKTVKKAVKPALQLTIKQENFCKKFIETGNASEAYRLCYAVGKTTKESTVNRSAKELLENPKITTRVSELMEVHAERHDITVDKLTNMYMSAFALGLAIENPSAMKQATDGLGKLHGLISDKGVIEVNGHVEHNHENLPLSETDKFIRSVISPGKNSTSKNTRTH